MHAPRVLPKLTGSKSQAKLFISTFMLWTLGSCKIVITACSQPMLCLMIKAPAQQAKPRSLLPKPQQEPGRCVSALPEICCRVNLRNWSTSESLLIWPLSPCEHEKSGAAACSQPQASTWLIQPSRLPSMHEHDPAPMDTTKAAPPGPRLYSRPRATAVPGSNSQEAGTAGHGVCPPQAHTDLGRWTALRAGVVAPRRGC